MVIEKIDIKSFGMITDMSLEFSDSVNVIEGQNEAGKSTIAAFVRYMLFGFEGTENEEVLSERRKRINWNTGIAQGSMVVRVKDKRYLISRSTVPTTDAAGRVAYKEDSSIIDLESGTTSFGKLPAGEVFFGVSNDLFLNTAFIGQIGDSGINEDSVKESIENILFSGSEAINNRKAMAKISEKMESLLSKGGSGGAIRDLMRKQEALEEELARSDEGNKRILSKETELFDIRKQRQDAEQRLNGLHELDDCYKNVMLIQTFDRLHELEESAKEKADTYNKFIEENTRADYVPTEGYLSDIAAARRNVNETYHALGEAEEQYAKEKSAIGITREIEGNIELSDELGGEENILKTASGARMGFFKSIAFGILTALGIVAATVLLIMSGDLGNPVLFTVLGSVLGVGALGGTVFFLICMLKDLKQINTLCDTFAVQGYADLRGKIAVISEARAKRDGMIRSTDEARIAQEKARVDYDNAKSELTRVIVRWGEEPPTSELNEFLDRLENKVSSFLERKRILYEDKYTIELTVKELRRNLSDKNEIDIRALVSPLRRKALVGIKHSDIISGITALKAKIVEYDKQAYAIESELVGLRSGVGDPADYYAKIRALDERIEEMKARHKAYFIAYKAIESASDNLRAGISPRLGEYSTALMAIMTNEKYKDFEVNPGLKVTFTSESGEKKSVDYLSGGTRDLAYIAVRLALIDMLYSEKPPVCFDESFAHQDNVRARAMMKALVHLSEKEGHQSFIFTCRGREAVLAKELDKNCGVFKLSREEDDIA